MRDSWGQNFRTKDGWTTSSINRLLKKFRDMGTVDRRQGVGRPRINVPARMKTLTSCMWTMVLSPEDQPEHTALSVKCHETGIPKSSVVRIKGSAAEMLHGSDMRKSWLRRTALLVEVVKPLLKKLFQFAADFIFFTDEKVFMHCGWSSEKIVKIS